MSIVVKFFRSASLVAFDLSAAFDAAGTILERELVGMGAAQQPGELDLPHVPDEEPDVVIDGFEGLTPTAANMIDFGTSEHFEEPEEPLEGSIEHRLLHQT